MIVLLRAAALILFVISMGLFAKGMIKGKTFSILVMIILIFLTVFYVPLFYKNDTVEQFRCVNNEVYEWSNTRKEYVPQDYVLKDSGWVKKNYCINWHGSDNHVRINGILFSKLTDGIYVMENMFVEEDGQTVIVPENSIKEHVNKLKIIEEKLAR